jgi:hypothetical protein
MDNLPKFSAGDLLQEIKYPDYYLFINGVYKDKYHVAHTWKPYDAEKYILYSKNAGHDSMVDCLKIEKEFIKVGRIPALVNKMSIRIDKITSEEYRHKKKIIVDN